MRHGLLVWENCAMDTAVESRTSNVESQADSRAAGTAAVQSRWREISGITVENEPSMTPKERRAAIRKLKALVEQEIREELKAAAGESGFTGERTYLWVPVPEI